jgi:iron complex transport system substrate-binding protein
MRRYGFLLLWLLCGSAQSLAADITDATGRTISLPEQIARVLPAGPPAAVLLAAVAPDLMLGWPSPVSDEARTFLSPEAARLPQVPRLTGREDVADKVHGLKPDLIVDYGSVSARYAELARATQYRTGIPTLLLDGSLTEIPHTLRLLGSVLHRETRAAAVADFAQTLLALPTNTGKHPRVLCARGADGLSVVAPGTDLAEIFTRLGWTVVAPDGHGALRQARFDEIRTLDPDILILSDPAMRETLATSAEWRSLRAVHEGHALIAPSLPFGWLNEPPSINRLLGLAWLSGRDPVELAASFNKVVYGRALTAPQLRTLLADTRQFRP